MWKIVALILFFGYLFMISNGLMAKDFRLEDPKIFYFNPKYLTDVNAKVTQTKRKVFVLNLNVTFLYPVGNNITAIFGYENINVENSKVQFEIKICDSFKQNWVKEAFLRTSDLKPVCPIPAGKVHFYGFELPPPDFPLAFPAGEYHMSFKYILTKTKEKVFDFGIVLKPIKRTSNNRRSGRVG